MNNDEQIAAAKMGAVWTGTVLGMQLSDLVLLATLVYTLLQIYVLIRDKVRDHKARKDKCE